MADTMAEIIPLHKECGLIVGEKGDAVPRFNNMLTLSPPLNSMDEDLSFVAETRRVASSNP